MSAPVRIQNALYEAHVEPRAGALVSRLIWSPEDERIDVLYSPHDRPKHANGIHAFGLWPLIPFANRCEHGLLLVGDEVIALPINEPDHDRTMHGCGWQSEWRVEEHTSHSIVLALVCNGFGPYRFRAEYDFRFLDDHVRFTLSTTNLSERALPFGLGFHPWFRCRTGTQLTIAAEGSVVFAEGFRPVGRQALDVENDFSVSRTVPSDRELAVNYLGWNGVAVLEDPKGLRIEIKASRNLASPLLWRPPHADFICFEPQSHALGAPGGRIGRSLAPLTMLGSEEKLSCWMTIKASKTQ